MRRGKASRARSWPGRGSAVAVAAAAGMCVTAFFVARFGSLREHRGSIEYIKLSSTPLVYLLSGLLSTEECDELVALGGPRMRPSEMGAAGSEPTGDGEASNRTSLSMFFDTPVDADEPLLRRLRQRWAEAAMVPLSQAEPTQLSRYARGQSYGLHLDASEEVPRMATLLTYLSDVSSGGETTFPRIAPAAGGDASAASVGGLMRPLAKLAAAGLLSRELAKGDKYCSDRTAVLRVAPRKGDGLLFFPLHPDGTADHDAVHGGCAVRGDDDVKWIAQQWFTHSDR